MGLFVHWGLVACGIQREYLTAFGWFQRGLTGTKENCANSIGYLIGMQQIYSGIFRRRINGCSFRERLYVGCRAWGRTHTIIIGLRDAIGVKTHHSLHGEDSPKQDGTCSSYNIICIDNLGPSQLFQRHWKPKSEMKYQNLHQKASWKNGESEQHKP